jgi:hypothetical protein
MSTADISFSNPFLCEGCEISGPYCLRNNCVKIPLDVFFTVDIIITAFYEKR